MQQRLADLVEDGAVELDLVALGVEADPLAEVAGQVTDQPGKALQHFAHRRHPRGDDFGLDLGDQSRDPVAHLVQRRLRRRGRDHAEPVLRHHQLAHLLHQRVEPAELHPDLPGLTARGGGLIVVEAHGIDVARAAEHIHDPLVAGRTGEPEVEAAVEIVAVELRQRGPQRAHHPERLGAPDDQRRPGTAHDGVAPEGHLHRPGPPVTGPEIAVPGRRGDPRRRRRDRSEPRRRGVEILRQLPVRDRLRADHRRFD